MWTQKLVKENINKCLRWTGAAIGPWPSASTLSEKLFTYVIPVSGFKPLPCCQQVAFSLLSISYVPSVGCHCISSCAIHPPPLNRRGILFLLINLFSKYGLFVSSTFLFTLLLPGTWRHEFSHHRETIQVFTVPSGGQSWLIKPTFCCFSKKREGAGNTEERPK